MGKIYTLNYFTDPGHGWLEVPKHLLVELGIQGDISSCSYMKDSLAYLEQDCDAGKFLQAYKAKHERIPSFKERFKEVTPIRTYEHYQL